MTTFIIIGFIICSSIISILLVKGNSLVKKNSNIYYYFFLIVVRLLTVMIGVYLVNLEIDLSIFLLFFLTLVLFVEMALLSKTLKIP